jgi:hypothetical protein
LDKGDFFLLLTVVIILKEKYKMLCKIPFTAHLYIADYKLFEKHIDG